MVGVAKIVAAPFLVGTVFLSQLPRTITNMLDLAALAVLVAGVFVVARYKAALDAADRTAEALLRERNAEAEHSSRLVVDVQAMATKIQMLESLPNVEKQEQQLGAIVDQMGKQTDLLQSIKAAVQREP